MNAISLAEQIFIVGKLENGVSPDRLSEHAIDFVKYLEQNRFVSLRTVIECTNCNKEFGSMYIADLLGDNSTLYCDNCHESAIVKEERYKSPLRPSTYQMMVYLIEKFDLDINEAHRIVIGGLTNKFLSIYHACSTFKYNAELILKEAYLQLDCSQCGEEERIKYLTEEQLSKTLQLSEEANSGGFSNKGWENYYNIYGDDIRLVCSNCYTNHDDDIQDLFKNLTNEDAYHNDVLSIEYDYKLNIDALLQASQDFVDEFGGQEQ